MRPMATSWSEDDTIVAPATPTGRAALAVIRISGANAWEIASRVFATESPGPLRAARARLGVVQDRCGERLDQGVIVTWQAPASFTGEDMAEITSHGSPVVVAELLAACVAAGARPAHPGEFTLRALRNGKIDLAQAEAIADLIAAPTVEQVRLSARQLAGEVGSLVGPLADAAFDLLADVEAGLDFADEEGLALEGGAIARRAGGLANELERALASSEAARRVREGARVVMSGLPNAGKSSLFNALIGFERAIVTEEPGTTRDLVEETVAWEGLPIVLVDGAGIGAAPLGLADAEGMRRSREAVDVADLVLHVYSLASESRPSGDSDPRKILVATHGDCPGAVPPAPGSFVVSSPLGQGIDEVRAEIARQLKAPGHGPIESVALASERHRVAARRAAAHLRQVADAASSGIGAEVLALDLRAAVHSLREILGDVGPDEVLGRVFSRFCIGK